MPAPSLKRLDVVINAHLQAAWRQAQAEHLDQRSAVRVEEGKLTLILGCDPSRSNRYAGWLARWRRQMWPVAGLRSMPPIEELEVLASGLLRFDLSRSLLPVAARDVFHYCTADDLLAANIAPPLPGKERARDVERAAADAGSDILFKHGRWRLVRLKTQQAAMFWGRGTRWCTAARSNNAFATYAGAGELWMLLTPFGRYQLAKATGEFRDAADRPVILGAVLRTAPAGLRRLMEP